MKLHCITFTGPDDGTDASEMKAISDSYPQVEWGILLSASQGKPTKGSPRFPSHRWLRQMMDVFEDSDTLFAGHLCGRYVRDIMNQGIFSALVERPELDFFGRYQINFHAEPFPFGYQNLSSVIFGSDEFFIFQMDGVNEELFNEFHHSHPFYGLVPLFDQSHGEGVLPNTWPDPIDGVICGFAGGLGPDNLEEQLARLADHVGDKTIYVDMETRIRNEQDQFDLDLVKRCIEIATPYF